MISTSLYITKRTEKISCTIQATFSQHFASKLVVWEVTTKKSLLPYVSKYVYSGSRAYWNIHTHTHMLSEHDDR